MFTPRRPNPFRVLARAVLAALTLVLGAASRSQAAAQTTQDQLCPLPTLSPLATLGGAADDDRRIARLLVGSARPFVTAARVSSDADCARTPSDSTRAPSPRPWSLAPAAVRLRFNSSFPDAGNDGLQWAGRGLSTSVTGGLAGAAGPLSWSLRPVVAWAQNQSFMVYDTVLADRAPYAYPWHGRRIDWPQRFGDDPVLWAHPGESFVRVRLASFEVGLSTEVLRWGPSRAYPLLLSGNAPGFAHLGLETSRPVDVGIGTLQGQIVWGLAQESDQFDFDPDNDRRLLSGAVLALRPAVLPDLRIGIVSLVHASMSDGVQGKDLFRFLQLPVEQVSGNLEGNGFGGLFVHWVLPASGFEAYAEWVRDDYSTSWTDLVSEPGHAQAYTVGFQQIAARGEHTLRVAGEITHLGNTERGIQDGRPYAVVYTHGAVTQGHTHKGQILGAFPGPGSDAQRFEIDLLGGAARSGVVLERIRFDEDAYERFKSAEYGRDGHDVQLSGSARHARVWSGVLVEAEVTLAFRRHRGFVDLVDGASDSSWKPNLGTTLQASWLPGS